MFKSFFKQLLLIFWIILVCILLITSTKPGLYLSFYAAKKWLPGHLSAQTLKGRLLDHFTIEGFRYDNPPLQISAQTIDFTWKPSNLFRGQFNLQSFKIGKLHINSFYLEESNISGYLFLKPSLPVNFVININRQPILFKGNSNQYRLSGNLVVPFPLSFQAELHHPFDDFYFNLDAQWKKFRFNSIETSGQLHFSSDQKNHLEGIIHCNDASLKIDGQYYPSMDLNWMLDVPKLSSFSPASGELSIKGRIFPKNNMTFNAYLSAKNLSYPPLAVTQLNAVLNAYQLMTDNPEIELNIPFKPGSLFYDDGTNKNPIVFQKADFTLNYQQSTLQAKTAWIFDKSKSFEGLAAVTPLNIREPDWEHLQKKKLSGNLKFIMKNLDFLNVPASPLKNTQGSLDAQFKLKGTLTNPLWEGLAILDGKTEIKDLQLLLDNIHVRLKSDPEKIILDGKISSGENSLSIEGEAPTQAIPQKLDIKVFGKNFRIMNTKEYKVDITPDLNIKWQDNIAYITGTVDIPYASIQPIEFNESLELPSDVVFVDKKKSENQSGIPVESHIQVRLGDKVTIDSHGLTGRLIGSVWITDKPREPTTGEGELSIIGGQYSAYGTNLKIDKGQILLSGGPVDNPRIFVRASRTFTTTSQLSPISNSPIPTASSELPTAQPLSQFNSIIVGIEVSGYLKNLGIRLFSIPATLSQSDILSFLVLGRPVSQASSADGQLLMRALSAMNIGGAESSQITQQLQGTLGLDTVNVETHSQYDPSQNTVTNSTSLVLGKALSPRLFIDYSIGILQSTNIFKVKYLLAPHWLLQTETNGSDNGVDILYSFSRE